MKLTKPAVLTAAAAAVAVLGAAPPAAADGTQLAAVRSATAKYHNVQAAIADGYLPSDDCVALSGVGGMGYHFVNPARVADGVLDPQRPEILVYAPTEDGLQLAAVEYFKADSDQDLATDADRPSLFGVPFDGPMPGHEPGMPVHYDLHAWIWKANPSGVFAAWNPRVTCGRG